MAGNAKSSADYQETPGWSPTLPPLSLAVGSSGSSTSSQRNPRDPQAPYLYFFLFLLLFFPVRAEAERRISLSFPAGQGVPAQCWHHMSREGQEQVGPWAAGQGNRWLHQGTKDCESTLDVEGTSQIKTFNGLPSLQSATSFKGEDKPFGMEWSTGD